MPSWNIHIAQTERLMERDGACARTVRDLNAFLFGNVVPDIFVGYMVPGITHPIPYRENHFASPEPIPKPREREFWDAFVAPLERRVAELPRSSDAMCSLTGSITPMTVTPARVPAPSLRGAAAQELDAAPLPAMRSLFDFTLGAWAHLLADNLWNTRVNQYLDARGERPSEGFRIKKQADFDGFGKTLHITSVPREDRSLIQAAEAFPQYPIGATYVHDTITVIHEIVRTNGGTDRHLPYLLLTDEFFASTFEEVLDTTDRAVAERL